jgi:hypothetical protein
MCKIVSQNKHASLPAAESQRGMKRFASHAMCTMLLFLSTQLLFPGAPLRVLFLQGSE